MGNCHNSQDVSMLSASTSANKLSDVLESKFGKGLTDELSENSMNNQENKELDNISHILSLSYLINENNNASIVMVGEIHSDICNPAVNLDIDTVYDDSIKNKANHLTVLKEVADAYVNRKLYHFIEYGYQPKDRLPSLSHPNVAVVGLDNIRNDGFIDNIKKRVSYLICNNSNVEKVTAFIKYAVFMPVMFYNIYSRIIELLPMLIGTINERESIAEMIDDMVCEEMQARPVPFLQDSKQNSVIDVVSKSAKLFVFRIVMPYIVRRHFNGNSYLSQECYEYVTEIVRYVYGNYSIQNIKASTFATELIEEYKFIINNYDVNSTIFHLKLQVLAEEILTEYIDQELMWLYDLPAMIGVSAISKNKNNLIEEGKLYHHLGKIDNTTMDTTPKNILYICGNAHVDNTINLLKIDGWELVRRKNRYNKSSVSLNTKDGRQIIYNHADLYIQMHCQDEKETDVDEKKEIDASSGTETVYTSYFMTMHEKLYKKFTLLDVQRVLSELQ